jgi:hypothetical protein
MISIDIMHMVHINVHIQRTMMDSDGLSMDYPDLSMIIQVDHG